MDIYKQSADLHKWIHFVRSWSLSLLVLYLMLNYVPKYWKGEKHWYIFTSHIPLKGLFGSIFLESRYVEKTCDNAKLVHSHLSDSRICTCVRKILSDICSSMQIGPLVSFIKIALVILIEIEYANVNSEVGLYLDSHAIKYILLDLNQISHICSRCMNHFFQLYHKKSQL